MGIMGAFVFAAQMINFTIPGTGSSGHIAGGMLLSAILGPFAGFITLVAVLAIQCLLFADGGLLALGCNIWNIAFYGCFVGAMFLWKSFMRKGITKTKILICSVLGCVITLQLGAFSVVLETYFSGITELPFSMFVAAMQPIHLVIGLIEGLITAAVLVFIHEARPELLQSGGNDQRIEKSGKLSYKTTLLILVTAFVVIGGAISLFASTHPDGLEWSIERITGSAQLDSSGEIYTVSEQIQEQTALLPDYSWKDSTSASGTSFSGIIGGIVVITVCIMFGRTLSLIRKSRSNERN
jgi:cobalt/nickel transport system permease protein